MVYNNMNLWLFWILAAFSFSPVQSLENVALGKQATQSGTHNGHTADRAVDGKKNPDLSARECAHPVTEDSNTNTGIRPVDWYKPAWWRVDLGQEFDIYQVKIYNRLIVQERLSNSWSLVSNELRPNITNFTICNEIMNGAQDIVTIQCTYNNQDYKRGRYVMIWSKHSTALTLCEVEVYSCPAGTWGMNLPGSLRDCSQLCLETCQNGETCRLSDGSCPSACSSGFWGRSCDQACHCAGAAPCDAITGSCGAAKCESGYITNKDGKCVTESEQSHSPNNAGTESPDHSAAITGLTAVVAVVGVVVVVLVVAVILLYKRNVKSSNQDGTAMETRAENTAAAAAPPPGVNPGFYEEVKEYETLKN